MSGLEATVLKLSEALEDNAFFRVDAEFFQKRFLQIQLQIEKRGARKLDDCKPTIIHPGEIPRVYVEEGGVLFFRAQNLRPMAVDLSNQVFISREDADQLASNQLQKNDVLMTRTGANCGDTLIFNEDMEAIASSHVFIIRNRQINQSFLATFLACKFGRLQIDRGIYGAAQPEIAPYYLRNIRVPVVSSGFAIRIESQIRKAHDLTIRSKALVERAEESLFLGLDLKSWQPDDPLSCTRSAAEVSAAGRFDADYFRPRYQSLLALLRRQGKTLRDVARLREDMFTPQPGQPFHYIEIGDLAADGAATSQVVPGEEAPSRATWIVQPGDVITSTVRPIRCLTGLIEPEQAENICSSGFAVLTPKGIPGELLFAYLRLPVICELMDLHTTASMYPAISTTDLMRLPFLLPDDATIKKVKQQITAARAARREAHVLLEKAKQAMEIAIEKDEAAGMATLAK